MQNASSYLIATHSYKCYQYIVTNYAVDVKQFCVEAVEKQLVYLHPDNKPKVSLTDLQNYRHMMQLLFLTFGTEGRRNVELLTQEVARDSGGT